MAVIIFYCACGGGLVAMYEMFAGTLETLEIAGMLINFHSGNSGTPYSIILAKVMPNFFVKFGMTC